MERLRRAAHAGSWYTNNGTYLRDHNYNFTILLSCCFFDAACFACLILFKTYYMVDVVSTLVIVLGHICMKGIGVSSTVWGVTHGVPAN